MYSDEVAPADDRSAVDALCQKLDIPRLAAVSLVNRGYREPSRALSYIRNDTVLLHDPFLLDGMEAAVEEILGAIERSEKICVYGDYDVDGITATAVMYQYLLSKGADAMYYIPDRRTEGYGMNRASVTHLAKQGVRLIVTVDNGITAVDEIALARDLGMTVVITDHHSCHEVLPDAKAIVNPHLPGSRYPFSSLAGVGVAFKTVCACETVLAKRKRRDVSEAVKALCMKYTELVAIGTVADVMPLRDENRLLCTMGLYILKSRPSVGIDALMYAASLGDTIPAASADYYSKRPRETQKRRINAGYISFVLAPRINAAGRVTHAYDALELLLADNAQKAMQSALALCEINTKRKSIENCIADEAIKDIDDEDIGERRVIVLGSDSWQHGVVGIVASRLCEKYGLPVVLVSFEDGIVDDCPSPLDIGKGSCRSIKGFDIHEALNACSDLFVRYGGHELAAGLTIYRKDLSELDKRINAYARENCDPKDILPVLDIDCEIAPEDMTEENANILSQFEPYGTENLQPVFCTREMLVKRVTSLSQGKYTKLLLEKGDVEISALCFFGGPADIPVCEGEYADVAYNLEVNEYKGFFSPQLSLKDIRPSEKEKKLRSESIALFDRFIEGDPTVDFEGETLPERSEFTAVYQEVRKTIREGFNTISVRSLRMSIYGTLSMKLTPFKTYFILAVFRELGLLSWERVDEDILHVWVDDPSRRADLEDSSLLQIFRRILCEPKD